MSMISDYGTLLLLLACAFGFFMAWGVGANDVANAVGPLAAIVHAVQEAGTSDKVTIPLWVMMIGAAGIR